MKYRTEINLNVQGTPFMPQGTHRATLWLDVTIDVPERYTGYIYDTERGKRHILTEEALDATELVKISGGEYFDPNNDTDSESVASTEYMPLAFHFGQLIVEKALCNYEKEN